MPSSFFITLPGVDVGNGWLCCLTTALLSCFITNNFLVNYMFVEAERGSWFLADMLTGQPETYTRSVQWLKLMSLTCYKKGIFSNKLHYQTSIFITLVEISPSAWQQKMDSC